jgi:hypothetical protein
MIKIKKSKWYPFNPYCCLPSGQIINHYVFRKEIHNGIPLKAIKKILDKNNISFPAYVRTVLVEDNKYIEYISLGTKQNG